MASWCRKIGQGRRNVFATPNLQARRSLLSFRRSTPRLPSDSLRQCNPLPSVSIPLPKLARAGERFPVKHINNITEPP